MATQLKQPSQFEIDGLADLLANFHDWSAAEVRAELESCVLDSFPSFSPDFVQYVLESFIEIDVQIRFNAHFDHVNFVNDKISDYRQRLFS